VKRPSERKTLNLAKRFWKSYLGGSRRRAMLKSLSAAFLALAAAWPAAAAVPSEETEIPYANRDGIVEWEVAGDDLLYIHALTGGWYRVRTMGRCNRLKTAVTLGFETSPMGELDRTSAIRVSGHRCPIVSVVRADGPPPRKRKS
jgi:hypothetical protein